LITEAIDLLENAKKVRIISHHDSDGIASAAIAKFTLERIGIPHEIIIKNQLLPEDLVGSEGLVYWFNDLGSSKMDSMRNIRGIITDHHTPAVKDVEYKENGNEIYQFNPHLEGIDGGISQSGATTTFLFSLNVIGDVLGVSYLSVVGSLGDLHDKRHRKLVGTDREVMILAQQSGLIEVLNDVRFFGRSSKAVAYMLRFGNDPKIPDLYDNPKKVYEILSKAGIEKEEGNKVTWLELDEEKRKTIIEEIKKIAKENGIEEESIFGEVYELKFEEKNSILRDVRDFTSVINAASRRGYPEVGIDLCLFKRGETLKRALELYNDHADVLRKASKELEKIKPINMGNIYLYDFSDSLDNNITGTIATRIATHHNLPEDAIVLVMANMGEYKKISGRISSQLAEILDLSDLMRASAFDVGGSGGGHRNAAGALIPKGKEAEFLKKIYERLNFKP